MEKKKKDSRAKRKKRVARLLSEIGLSPRRPSPSEAIMKNFAEQVPEVMALR